MTMTQFDTGRMAALLAMSSRLGHMATDPDAGGDPETWLAASQMCQDQADAVAAEANNQGHQDD